MATTTTMMMMSIGTGAGLGIGTGTGTVGLLSSATTTTATTCLTPLSRNNIRAAATNSGRRSLLFPSYPCLKAKRTTGRIVCEVAVGSASVEEAAEAEAAASAKIGSKVKVKVPLKVYHVPRVGEVDITGMEGELKQYVALWKGKRISANLPYKIQFFVDIEGRGSVKFFAHLKEDEFEYI